jgi:hypothetical protein
MFNKTTIALSIAIILSTASAGFAASKHPLHHLHQRSVVERQRSGAGAYGFAITGNTFTPSVLEAMRRQAAGDPRCWGSNCDPTDVQE